jgi:hypothetical protein
VSDLVSECLLLRRWAIALLAHGEPANAASTFPPVAPTAWPFFLAAESCARSIASRLGNDAARLPTDARTALEAAARDEVQRVMAARAQLFTIDALAERCGVDPVVLKGGLHAVDGGESFDLCDVDLLLPPAQLATLQHEMTARGGYTYDAALDQLSVDRGIIVELHDHLEVGHRTDDAGRGATRPLPRFRRLRGLTPADHLIYCIQHTTTKHPMRRGHLRDALLLADAMDDCSVTELQSVKSALGVLPIGAVYLAALEFSAALSSHHSQDAPAPDPFAHIAASKYATSKWFPKGSMATLPIQFDHVAQFVSPPGEWSALVRGYLAADYASSRGDFPAVARHSRTAARALTLATRTPFRVIVLANALACGLVVRACYAARWRRAATASPSAAFR